MLPSPFFLLFEAKGWIDLQLRALSHPPSPAHAETCAFPSEHRQTELVRPGARHIDLGDGIRPIVLGARRASKGEQPALTPISPTPGGLRGRAVIGDRIRNLSPLHKKDFIPLARGRRGRQGRGSLERKRSWRACLYGYSASHRKHRTPGYCRKLRTWRRCRTSSRGLLRPPRRRTGAGGMSGQLHFGRTFRQLVSERRQAPRSFENRMPDLQPASARAGQSNHPHPASTGRHAAHSSDRYHRVSRALEEFGAKFQTLTPEERRRIKAIIFKYVTWSPYALRRPAFLIL